jgi:hypothetical protein
MLKDIKYPIEKMNKLMIEEFLKMKYNRVEEIEEEKNNEIRR